MAAVHHLGFVGFVGPPTKTHSWLLSPVKSSSWSA